MNLNETRSFSKRGSGYRKRREGRLRLSVVVSSSICHTTTTSPRHTHTHTHETARPLPFFRSFLFLTEDVLFFSCHWLPGSSAFNVNYLQLVCPLWQTAGSELRPEVTAAPTALEEGKTRVSLGCLEPCLFSPYSLLAEQSMLFAAACLFITVLHSRNFLPFYHHHIIYLLTLCVRVCVGERKRGREGEGEKGQTGEICRYAQR